MSRIVAAGAAFAFAIAGIVAGSWAQGLVTMQKLSAPPANELVGVRQAMLRGNGAPIHTLFFKEAGS